LFFDVHMKYQYIKSATEELPRTVLFKHTSEFGLGDS
jgi:hypothetical protein